MGWHLVWAMDRVAVHGSCLRHGVIRFPDRLAVRETSHEAIMAPYACSDVGRGIGLNWVAIGNRKAMVCIASPNREADAIEVLAKLKLPGVATTPVTCLRWRDDTRGLVAGVARGSEYRLFLLHWDGVGAPLSVSHSLSWSRGHGERLLGVDWFDGYVLGVETAACVVFREDQEQGTEPLRLTGGRRERATRTCKRKRRICLQAETPIWCMGAVLGSSGDVLCAWDNRTVRWHLAVDGGHSQGTVVLNGLVLGMFRMGPENLCVVNSSEVMPLSRPPGEEASTESTTVPGEFNGETTSR